MDFNFSYIQVFFVLLVSYALYGIALVAYRLFLSPVKNFPGPLLPAVTLWYEFYYDAILGGQYEWKIAEFHKRYGPIVRVGPDEVHINDPDFYDTVYNAGILNGKRVKINRWKCESAKWGVEGSTFATTGHNLHRNRRAAISPSFSARAVANLTPIIQDKTDYLVDRLAKMKGSGKPVNLFAAYGGLTSDIITHYSFGKPLGLLEAEDFAAVWHKLLHDMGPVAHWMKQFRIIGQTMQALPDAIAVKLNPPLTELTRLQRLIKTQIHHIVDQLKAETEKDDDTLSHNIFHAILSSDLPASEKEVERLTEEATILMTAGTATTTDTLAKITFFLLSQPEKLERLRQELKAVPRERFNGDSRKWMQHVEQLPYVNAILKEGLRLTGGVMHRLHRIFPENDLEYNGRLIPRGTPISMSIWNIHKNPDIFPDPESFQPERWLKQDNNPDTKLEKYLVPFSKGTRQCVAQNLAWAEMYLALATVFDPEQLQLELYETTYADVEGVRDNFMEGFRPESKGVRVVSV